MFLLCGSRRELKPKAVGRVSLGSVGAQRGAILEGTPTEGTYVTCHGRD